MRKISSVIDEQKIFEYYLLRTIRRSKSQVAKKFGISSSDLKKIYDANDWEQKISKYEREMELFFRSEKSLQLLYKAITEKLEDSDSLEKMSLENTAKLATTLVKLMPDLEAATSIKKDTSDLTNNDEDLNEKLELIRQDKVCMEFVYKIIDRLEELEQAQTKSQK